MEPLITNALKAFFLKLPTLQDLILSCCDAVLIFVMEVVILHALHELMFIASALMTALLPGGSPTNG
jgi:hypothetical protein